MSKKKFVSDALKVNLAETRKANIVIPEHHQQLLSLSAQHWGIHQRTESFFLELYHPYTNHRFVVDEYRKILLGDAWLYEQLSCPGEVFCQWLDIASGLLDQPIGDEESEQLLRSCLEFTGQRDPDDKKITPALVHHLVTTLKKLVRNQPVLLVENSDLLKKHLGSLGSASAYEQILTELLRQIAKMSLETWRNTTPAADWFAKQKDLFGKGYGAVLKEIGEPFFQQQEQMLNQASTWEDICSKVFFYNEMATRFRGYISRFDKHIERFYYILFLLHLPGMTRQQQSLLWELNKVLRNIRGELDSAAFTLFLDNIFGLFEELKQQHMSIVLECMLTLGKAVIEVEDRRLISLFENKLIELGFVGPGKVFIQDNWQMKVDPNHVKNIRVWLELIMHAPYTFRKLLSALIVNLHLGGIFIFDTDLFQRDISQLLNSDISPLYKQIKQLTRIFPVYFNEIGAEGELREVTTVMDELSGRQDRLIHFLRKQIHIEGNNTHIILSKQIFLYWCDGRKSHLEGQLPAEVLDGINNRSRWFQGVNALLQIIMNTRHCSSGDLLKLGIDQFKAWVEQAVHDDPVDKKRLMLLFKLYVLLREKYSFDIADITSLLGRYRFFTRNEIQQLERRLGEKDLDAALHQIFDFIEKLNHVIFDPAFSEGWESIYHKRHIAFGIPSMYGQYREDKFEALGLIFRLERLAANLMEDKIYTGQTSYITARTLKASYDILSFFRRGLGLDGITSQGLDANLQMLKYGLTSESFTLGQFVNLFQFMSSNVKEITNTYFFGFYDRPLRTIIPQIFDPGHQQDEKGRNELIVRHSESFYREILYASFLIQPLDNYIARMIHLLHNMVDNFPPDIIRNIMSYDPELLTTSLFEETPKIDNQIFLGSKAYFQKKLYLKGFPVPPGVVLTTELFRRRQAINFSTSLEQEVDLLIREQIRRLEQMTGQVYGDPGHPLLLSVRSGTAISMPGAMNTFLNVGMNDEIVEALSRQPNFGWTSWDCYRRLLQSWGMIYGINRDVFDQVMIAFKERYRVEQKIHFTASRMREMAFAYKDILAAEQVRFMEDPWMQLKQAISSVFDSWGSARAKVYRDHLQIADQWGTAVVMQQMVLGNIDLCSGTGVVFTHNPMLPKPGIYLNGDFTLCSQGEDIVAGLVHAQPVSKIQKSMESREGQQALEEVLPDIYQRLLEIAHQLVEEQGYNHLEIEFTFESSDPEDLYILQIRDQDTKKTEQLQVFAESNASMHLLGRGIGGAGGALNGRVAIDMDDLISLRNDHPGEPCILLRPDTVPDDIPLIFECDGLVASRGGTTSHAAVTAARIGKVCVLNCRTLTVNEQEKVCHINGEKLLPGDRIAIDGFSGDIFKGNYRIDTTEIIR